MDDLHKDTKGSHSKATLHSIPTDMDLPLAKGQIHMVHHLASTSNNLANSAKVDHRDKLVAHHRCNQEAIYLSIQYIYIFQYLELRESSGFDRCIAIGPIYIQYIYTNT